MPQGKHILVVDHTGDVLDVLIAILRDRGYRASPVTGGVEMRDFLSADDPVDAVVLDSSGFGESSASLALHAKELRLPLVMITGNPTAFAFAEKHGMQLLHKPFRSDELYTALDKAFTSGEFGQRDV